MLTVNLLEMGKACYFRSTHPVRSACFTAVYFSWLHSVFSNVFASISPICWFLLVLSHCPVYFYNFGWKDYGVASLTTILDMVKVMTFALQEGKVAIHCHAGLGRTGKF